MKYDVFIGLETHIHLLTASKAFCGCRAAYGDPPNTNVCPICLGYPGVLPALNAEAVRMAYLVARALNCELSRRTTFDRKNYFYPDMTKNYQISQFHFPVGRHGYFDIEVDGETRRIGIHDVHLEEDAGKMIHSQSGSLIDYNRAGTALLEIVTEPDLRDGSEAEIYIQSFRRLVRYLRVCDGNMEEGSLRCDANVSINHPGMGLGVKTEIKNMNSSRFARKALEYEIKRQSKILDSGKTVSQETRLFDEARGVTETMRSKENAHDYRYFPEPDLPPFTPSEAFLNDIERSIPELPLARKKRFENELQVKPELVEMLAEERDAADFFEAVVALGAAPGETANWLCGHVQAQLNRAGSTLSDSPLTPRRLKDIMKMVETGRIGLGRGKQVLELVFERDADPEAIVEAEGLEQVGDASSILAFVEQALAANSKTVAQIEGGDSKPLGFLVGQVMKLSSGRADPKMVMSILKKKFGL